MPALDLDMLIAFTNKADKHHKIADTLFFLIKIGKIRNVYLPVSVAIEYELVHKSRGISEEQIAYELFMFKKFPNLRHYPLNLDILILASKIRRTYNISYFDSIHAATAIKIDKQIISTDDTFDKIENLKRLDPYQYVIKFE